MNIRTYISGDFDVDLGQDQFDHWLAELRAEDAETTDDNIRFHLNKVLSGLHKLPDSVLSALSDSQAEIVRQFLLEELAPRFERGSVTEETS